MLTLKNGSFFSSNFSHHLVYQLKKSTMYFCKILYEVNGWCAKGYFASSCPFRVLLLVILLKISWTMCDQKLSFDTYQRAHGRVWIIFINANTKAAVSEYIRCICLALLQSSISLYVWSSCQTLSKALETSCKTATDEIFVLVSS